MLKAQKQTCPKAGFLEQKKWPERGQFQKTLCGIVLVGLSASQGRGGILNAAPTLPLSALEKVESAHDPVSLKDSKIADLQARLAKFDPNFKSIIETAF